MYEGLFSEIGNELLKILAVILLVIGLIISAVKGFGDDGNDNSNEIRVSTPLKPTKLELEIISDTEIGTIYAYDLDKLIEIND